MNLKNHLPNALTCCNLLCGCVGILYTVQARLDFAFYLVLVAAVFDFFDGFAARMLKVTSAIGKDLDSLADMVTFGVLPGFIVYKMLELSQQGKTGTTYSSLIPYLAFIIPVFSALRLAKFNNDTRQSDSFIGVNTPANTLLISSLGYILVRVSGSANSEEMDLMKLLLNPYLLIPFIFLMSFLLVSELPIFALKFKNFGWADNKIRYVFLIIAVVLLILFQFFAFPFIIFLYIFLSVINNVFTKNLNNTLTK